MTKKRRTFDEWLAELKNVVRENLECELEELSEYDVKDALGYYKEGSNVTTYFRECLRESCEEDKTIAIRDVFREL